MTRGYLVQDFLPTSPIYFLYLKILYSFHEFLSLSWRNVSLETVTVLAAVRLALILNEFPNQNPFRVDMCQIFVGNLV